MSQPAGSRWWQLYDDAKTRAFAGALILAILVPLVVGGGQVVFYLYTGVGLHLSVIDALLVLRPLTPPSMGAWATDPESWFGLHSVCLRFPLALALSLIGFLCCWLVTLLPDRPQEEE
jgi:hypothetical protein